MGSDVGVFASKLTRVLISRPIQRSLLNLAVARITRVLQMSLETRSKISALTDVEHRRLPGRVNKPGVRNEDVRATRFRKIVFVQAPEVGGRRNIAPEIRASVNEIEQ